MSAELLTRHNLARIIDSGDALSIFGPGGSTRRFEGDSAALARSVLELLDQPQTKPQLLARLSEAFDGVEQQAAIIDELLGHLQAAGAIGAPHRHGAGPQRPPLWGARIVLGATGAVATAFLPQLIAALQGQGAEVRVALSRAARRFVEPRALEALTHHPVATSLWETVANAPAPHIALAEWADAVVIAPCSATTMSRMVRGDFSEVVAAAALTTSAPVLLAPSMNPRMWAAPAVRRNVETLQNDGVFVLWPSTGPEVAHRPGARTAVRGPMLPVELLADTIARWLPLVRPLPTPSTADFWNAVYRSTPAEQLPWHRDAPDDGLMAALRALPVPSRVLDLGTGLGSVAAAAASLGHAVTATDISEVAIELASARNPGVPVTWVVDDALASRLRGAFDVVIDRALLHVLRPQDRDRWLSRVQSWLKPGGTLLLIAHTSAADPRFPTQRFSAASARELLTPALEVSQAIETTVTSGAAGDGVLIVATRRAP